MAAQQGLEQGSAPGSDRSEGAWLAHQAAGGGTWQIDPSTGQHFLSSRSRELLGIEGDGPISVHRLLAALHPGDRERWREAVAQVLDLEGSGECHLEVRTSGAAERWLAASGRAFFQGAGAEHVLGTFQDITEQKLKEARRDVRLGDLGHELRMPLNALSMGIGLFQENAPVGDRVLSSMRSAVERMDRLIDQHLSCASNDTDELVLKRERASLAEICREAIDEVSLVYPDHRIELEALDEGFGEWDFDCMVEVAQNLLSNALRHGAARRPIVVTIADCRGAAMLAVANFGQPLPRRFAEQLADPVRRAAVSSEHRGLGIVKEIVLAHGGRIELNSDDASTTFRLWLPVRPIQSL
jgi:signal transduction histidine kinase